MRCRKLISAIALGLVAAFYLAGPTTAPAQVLTFPATNLVDVTQISGNETDPEIAINVQNPSNMVIAAATDAQSSGLLISMTTNMGATWATNIIATNTDSQGLLPAYGEPSVAWDVYGNVFLAYLTTTLEGVAVAISTNGGQNFAMMTNLAPLDSTDQPKLTSPPVGAAAGTVWILYKDYSLANSPLVVQGLQSTGLGTNGIFGPVEMVPNSADGGYGDIAAGPRGELMVGFQNNTRVGGIAAKILISVNTNGIGTNGLGTNDFPVPVVAASNAIGGFTYISAAPTGIGVNAATSVGWDCDPYSPNFDRAYVTYTGVSTNGGNTNGGNLVIDICHSVDGGATWSANAQVNDDTGSSDHFLPRMAVDPTTGIIGFSWMDCRNDQGGNSMVITKTFTRKITLPSFMVTNLTITPTNAEASDPSVNTSWTDNNGSRGTNLTVKISGNNIIGTLVTNDALNNIYVYGGTNTNFVISAQGNATNVTASFTIIITDNYPNAFTSGSSNSSAIAYTTISLDGGLTFQPNQALIAATLPINAPAIGFASSISGSDSLTGWGHHTALAAYGANFFPVWPDSSDITTNNPDGGGTNFDLDTIAGGLSVVTADISIFVTNSPNPVISDGNLVYTVIVSNAGPKLAKPITISDQLPSNVNFVTAIPALGGTYVNNGGNIVFSFASLAPHSTLTNTIRVNATGSALATNIAVVSDSVLDLVTTNNTNVLVLAIAGQDLALTMTASESNVLIGDVVTNWITVTNLGPSANQPVLITNTFSGNWTNISVQAAGTSFVSNNVAVINLGILPIGQAVTSIVTAVVTSQGLFATNQATVSSQDVDTNLSDNSAAITYFVNGETLGIGISASPTNVNLGDTVTYVITVTNFGLSFTGDITVTNYISTNLGNVTITPSQGEGAVFNNGSNNVVIFELGELSAGEVATQIVTAVALSSPAMATNIGMLGSTDFDTNIIYTVATNLVSINGEDLGISLAASPPDVQVSQTVTFTEVITNFGPSTNGIVLVTNVLSSKLGQVSVLQPAGNSTISGNTVTFNLGTMAAGQSQTLIMTAVAQSIGTATNTGSVFSANFDTNSTNNSARTLFTINPTLPMISNLVVTPLASSAFIRWKTGGLATAQVQYGLTSAYGSVSSFNGAASSNHLVLLTGLARDTNYYFNVESWVGGTLYTTNGTFFTTDTLILNTQDANYKGIWNESSVGAGIFGAYYQSANTAQNNSTAWAVYDPNIPAAGTYDIAIWYPQNPAFTTNAQVYISGATNELSFSVNETSGGGSWQTLASNVYFASGLGGNVTIYNNTGETNKSVVANAMRWAYDTGQDNPTNRALPAWWSTYFFGTNVTISGVADADGDGYSNYAEFALGTYPSDPASRLTMNVSRGTNGSVSVIFYPWQGGRNYQLVAASDLTSANWTPLTNRVSVGTNGYGMFTIGQPSSTNSFYRLSVQVLSQ